ncbi:hypothetical protein E2C01_038016 [Portunus trituberculatus]|uniref:Uncharacterized protein n=1 Tax=Portunus trituberculatus TaxID=210409 RepID=A0A5B7FIR9_PORTR|nr:hypothetical protein [Portunus trituberculatus]
MPPCTSTCPGSPRGYETSLEDQKTRWGLPHLSPASGSGRGGRVSSLSAGAGRDTCTTYRTPSQESCVQDRKIKKLPPPEASYYQAFSYLLHFAV